MSSANSAETLLQSRLRRFFREDFYLATYPDVARSGMLPLEHFVKFGCKESRRPNGWYSDRLVPADLLALEEGTAPYVIFLTHLPGLDERQFESLCRSEVYADEGHPDCWQCEAMRESFNGRYYRRRYPELAPDIDALAHYCEAGWKDGRDPAPNFRTDYYLAANTDVREAGCHPFVHYLSAGIDEGRKGCPPDPVERGLLESLRGFREMARDYKMLVPVIDIRPRGQLFATLLGGRGRLALSVSHDNYVLHVGGIQKFIAEEAQALDSRGIDYLHLSPTVPNIRWVGGDESTCLVNVNLNGEFAGTFTAEEIGQELRTLTSKRPDMLAQATLHSALGWNREALQFILCAGFAERRFYVHDYHALCPEYRLLRNHVEPCDAPPLDSRICSLCLHGSEREKHVREYQNLVSAFSPTFIYPSECARQVFEGAGVLMEGPGRVVPHMQVADRNSDAPVAVAPALENLTSEPYPMLKVAFCGHPVAHKGYAHFKAIADHCLDMGDLQFVHLGAEPGDAQGVKFVRASLRDGVSEMVEKLRAERVDLVFVGSTWRETFNFVAYEALQAGAAIVTLECAGNVADLVEKHGVGAVTKDWQEVVALIKSGDFHQRVNIWRSSVATLEIFPNPALSSGEYVV